LRLAPLLLASVVPRGTVRQRAGARSPKQAQRPGPLPSLALWSNEETQDRDGDDAASMAPADGPSALPLLNQASTTYRIAIFPQAGRRIARIGGGVRAPQTGGCKPLCAEIADFTLHAATRCRAGDRHRLARLCRYVMRPAFADDQMRWDGGSRVSFKLKTPWRDGTTSRPQRMVERAVVVGHRAPCLRAVRAFSWTRAAPPGGRDQPSRR
jgi:hypothetical protein